MEKQLNLLDVPQTAPQDWSNEALEAFLRTAVQVTEQDRKENQIRWYRPVSKKALQFHESKAHVVAAGGGNGSAKTETMLVEEPPQERVVSEQLPRLAVDEGLI